MFGKACLCRNGEIFLQNKIGHFSLKENGEGMDDGGKEIILKSNSPWDGRHAFTGTHLRQQVMVVEVSCSPV